MREYVIGRKQGSEQSDAAIQKIFKQARAHDFTLLRSSQIDPPGKIIPRASPCFQQYVSSMEGFSKDYLRCILALPLESILGFGSVPVRVPRSIGALPQ